MPIDPEEFYWTLEAVYRNGVLDRVMEIQGEAIEGVLLDTGLNIGDLLNKMDGASDETVQKMERLLERTGPFLKYVRNDRVLQYVARALDVAYIRRAAVNIMKSSLTRAVTGQSPPTVSVRIRQALSARVS